MTDRGRNFISLSISGPFAFRLHLRNHQRSRSTAPSATIDFIALQLPGAFKSRYKSTGAHRVEQIDCDGVHVLCMCLTHVVRGENY